jgi:hypothetical protein
MKEAKKLFIPDYQELFPVPGNGPVRLLLNPPKDDYREKEREVLPTSKDLPPDHLNAT